MQTISDLNKKWWYRFIKVLFFSLIAIAIYFATIINLKNNVPNEEISLNNSFLICEAGNNKTFSFQTINTVKNSRYAYEKLEEDWTRDDLIGELCGIVKPQIKNEYIPISSQSIGFDIDRYDALEVARASLEEKIQLWRKEVLSSHKLEKNNVTIGSWFEFGALYFLSLLSIVVMAEFIRRIFYYIVLGKIKPEK